MNRSLLRPLLILAVVGAAAFATVSSAFAHEGPAHWNYETCHATWDGKTLCLESHGIFDQKISESGRLTHLYLDRATITIYNPDGSVVSTERRQYHLIGHGPNGDVSAQKESLHYRYESGGYSCKYSFQLHQVDGEVVLDHEVGDCTIS